MALNADPPPISPEMRAFAQELARMVQEATCAEHRRSVAAFRDHLDNRLNDMGDRIEARIERLRSELREELADVKREQKFQATTLDAHGKAIARVESRLENGDREFFALEKRMSAVEGSDVKSKVTLAQIGAKLGILAAQAGLAGACAAYILAKLGH